MLSTGAGGRIEMDGWQLDKSFFFLSRRMDKKVLRMNIWATVSNTMLNNNLYIIKFNVIFKRRLLSSLIAYVRKPSKLENSLN